MLTSAEEKKRNESFRSVEHSQLLTSNNDYISSRK